MENNNNGNGYENSTGGGPNGGRKPSSSSSRPAGRKRVHESSSTRSNGRSTNRQQDQQQYNDLELLLGPTVDAIIGPAPQQLNMGAVNGQQFGNTSRSTMMTGGGMQSAEGGRTTILPMSQQNEENLNSRGGSVSGVLQRGVVNSISATQPHQLSTIANFSNFLDDGTVNQWSGGGSTVAPVSTVPMWNVDNHGLSRDISVFGGGGRVDQSRTGPSALSLYGKGGALQALPTHVREAIAAVNARQMMRMVSTQPEYASVLPAIGELGFSNIEWLLLDWSADMVMQRMVGLVVLAGPFTTQTEISGYDVRLIFDNENMEHKLAVHGWQESVVRMENIQPGQIVEFTRLKVREQGRNLKGSFPYIMLYNSESRHRIIRHVQSSVVNAINCSTTNTPIIVEATEQNNNNNISNGGPCENQGSTAPHEQSQQQTVETPALGQIDGGHEHQRQSNSTENEEDRNPGEPSGDVRHATTTTPLSSRVAEMEHLDNFESTAWLSASRPPLRPSGRLRHSFSAVPGQRSSPPPPRASSISAQQSLHSIVQQINVIEEEFARDERIVRGRQRRQRARRQLQQRGGFTISAPPPSFELQRPDVITIDSEMDEALGVEQQQRLLRGDARFYDDELLTIEDEVGTNEIIMLDNKPLTETDREWLLATGFKMRALPSSVKGSIERGEMGNNNLSCSICYDWLVSDTVPVIRLACQHFLHADCLGAEAKLRSFSPLCRRHFITGEQMIIGTKNSE